MGDGVPETDSSSLSSPPSWLVVVSLMGEMQLGKGRFE